MSPQLSSADITVAIHIEIDIAGGCEDNLEMPGLEENEPQLQPPTLGIRYSIHECMASGQSLYIYIYTHVYI